MEYSMRIDKDEAATAPGVKEGDAGVDIRDGRLRVRLGVLFETDIDLAVVEGASLLPDPRPHVFMPIGVSAAVEQFGPDVLAAIGAYEGLVRVDLSAEVTGHTRAPDFTPEDEVTPANNDVQFRHLILSLEKPDDLIAALTSGGGGEGVAS